MFRQQSAHCLSILGTGSDVGKSVVATALCRIISDKGVRVAPFKAQNMSNNSYVTSEGGEMGRAQIVQAQAARTEPHVDMNPVLLKPCSDTGAQVVLHGRPLGNREAGDYFGDTRFLFEEARKSLKRLCSRYDVIIMEGAGSCAEVNLRANDFVNFRMAHEVDAPVILVADIDRGGVFAQIIGTLAVLPEEDRGRIRGIIINRFRGDLNLFKDGVEYITGRTGLPVLGVVPYYRNIRIEAEDGLQVDSLIDPAARPDPARTNIAVLRLPHISNFTDFGPLEHGQRITLHYLSEPRSLDGYDIVLIPGTKNVRFDLEWVRKTGWSDILYDYVHKGGEVGGICGGYQMLGRMVRDPDGIEGESGETAGLGLLGIETTLLPQKTLCRSSGVLLPDNEPVEGYEIHMGKTERDPGVDPLIRVTGQDSVGADRYDGAVSSGGRIWGTYFHGLFDSAEFRRCFLQRLSPDHDRETFKNSKEGIDDFRDRQYNLLADHFREHLDMPGLLRILF